MSEKDEIGKVRAYRLIAGFSDSPVIIAALLFDIAHDELHTLFRGDLSEVIPEEELDVVQLIEGDLKKKLGELGATALIAWMEDTLSNYIRLQGPYLVFPPEDWELELMQMLSKDEIVNN